MSLIKTIYDVDHIGSVPERLKGLRIALLADFHNGEPGPILEILRDDVPDAIMIPGDVVLGYFPEGDELIIDTCKNISVFLEGCAGIAPTYMSLGNHECLLCDEDHDRLRAAGITLLDNEWTELTLHRTSGTGSESTDARINAKDPADRILVGGLTSAYAISYRRFRSEYNAERDEEDYVRYPYRSRPKDILKRPTDSGWLDEFAGQEGYKILLSHHPEYWCMREPMLRSRRIDLVLSGHAHGGQWQIFGRGVYAPGQGLLPAYTKGVHFGPHGRMIVSRGMSNPYSYAPRIGNPCEVIYIRFR